MPKQSLKKVYFKAKVRNNAMCSLKFSLLYFYLIVFDILEALQKAKNNGDIYIVSEDSFIEDIKEKIGTESPFLLENINSTTTTSLPDKFNTINFDELIATCNSSFYIPMHYYIAFKTTAELPDLVDKTGMCFIRCLFEKSGLIENWKLDAEKIRKNIWPAMGDTIEVCQAEGATEKNACVRTYAIAKCLTLRSLVDARNNPV